MVVFNQGLMVVFQSKNGVDWLLSDIQTCCTLMSVDRFRGGTKVTTCEHCNEEKPDVRVREGHGHTYSTAWAFCDDCWNEGETEDQGRSEDTQDAHPRNEAYT